MKAHLLYFVLPFLLFFSNNHAQDFKTAAKCSSLDSIYKQIRTDRLNKVQAYRHYEKPTQTDAEQTAYRPLKITVDDTARHGYTYDGKGKQLTELNEKLSAGAWVNSTRNSYTYDINTTTYLTERWENGAWVNSSRESHTGDSNGNDTYLNEKWENGAWVNSTRESSAYGSNAATSLTERWENGAWVNFTRESSTYDSNGNSTSLDEKWENGAWVNSSRDSYTNDGNGNTIFLSENWVNGAWINSNRYSSTHDSNGKELSSLSENWENDAWVNSFRNANTYDNAGNEISSLTESWEDGVWVSLAKDSYTYDNGKMLSHLMELSISDAWMSFNKEIYTYDSNGNAVKGEAFSCTFGQWRPSSGFLRLQYNGPRFISYIASVVEAEYITVTAVNDKTQSPNTFALEQNYPNPFNPATKIKFNLSRSGSATLDIFNSLGQRVAALIKGELSAGVHEVTWNAQNLPSGVYICRLTAGNERSSKKLILMK